MTIKPDKMSVMINRFTKIFAAVKGYVSADWGAPFIVGFMLLLIVAAVSLSMGLAALADGVAVVAYYAILVGVVLQLVCFLKCSEQNGGKGS